MPALCHSRRVPASLSWYSTAVGHRATIRLATLTLVLGGCTMTHLPTTPRVAADEHNRVELRSLERSGWSVIGSYFDVTVQFDRLAPGIHIERVLLTRHYERPCSNGLSASEIESIDGRPWSGFKQRPDPGQRVRLRFQGQSYLMEGPTRIDVLLREPDGRYRCAELPLVQRAPNHDWEQVEDWTWGVTMGAAWLPDSPKGVDALLMFRFPIGKRFGDIHLIGEPILGATSCSKRVCEPMPGADDMEVPNEHFLYGAGAGASIDLAQWGFLSLGAGLRYRLLASGVDAREGEEDFLIQHLTFVPMINFVEPDPYLPGIPGGTATGWLLGLYAPVGWASLGSAESLSIGGYLVLQYSLM